MTAALPAVYLVAGEGRRLRPLTDDRAKAMTELGGSSLADRALRSLREAGVERIVAVTGHRSDSLAPVEQLISERIANPRYADAGNLYSLWCARQIVEGGCYVINSDVLFEDEIARRLVALEGSALICDGSQGVDEESMKVVSKADRLVRLSKRAPGDSNAEYVGLARIDPAHGPLLAAILGRLVETDAVHDYYEAAIEELASAAAVGVARVDGLAWIEIDDHDDLERARAQVVERVG